MVNKDYRTVQIPKSSYTLVREYCDKNNLKLGKFIGQLIQERCAIKKPNQKNVLRVETRQGVS